MRTKKQHYVTLGLILLVYLVTTMWVTPPGPGGKGPGMGDPYPADPGKFVGSAACQSCHKDIYATHLLTAHYRDSRPATKETIKGRFTGSQSHFDYNAHMRVELEKKGDKYYQSGYFNGTLLESEAFDIVIGSGRKGQSYLYWDQNQLFQLPISYYTPANSWCNSPGYPENLVYYNKQVRGNCMQCHSTYASAAEDEVKGTTFDKPSIIYGVDCERCHGAAADHVTWHQAHPGEKTGRYIINTHLMSRQQRLDACALCHSGFRQEIRPAFTFQSGDTLDNYSTATYSSDSVSTLDVHGNQYGLLTSSKCFKMSEMDCSSCHNVHVDEYNAPSLYSQRCMNCHQEASHNSCTFAPVKELKLSGNCIDCHMPSLPSNKIFLEMSDPDKSAHDLVRTHRVGIYPEVSKAYLEKIRKH